MDRRDSRYRPIAIVLVVLTVGCAPGAGEGPGHRAQRLALSPQDEYELGVRAYAEVLNEARQKNALVTGGPAAQRVTRVGRRIAAVATGNSRMSQLLRHEINLNIEGYRFDWEFNVINSNQVNAFCLPGGKVVVFTGLLTLIGREGRGHEDDWLATVLGHEISHALAHHASERLARESLTEKAGQVVASGIGAISPEERDRLLKVLAVGGKFGSLPFDRRQESEADHIGVFLMTFAGYDPHAAVEFWEAMAQHGTNVPEILSDHPSDARRIAQLRQWAEQARAAKQAFDSGNTVDAAR